VTRIRLQARRLVAGKFGNGLPAVPSRLRFANTENSRPWRSPHGCDARSARSVNASATQLRPRWRDASLSMALLTSASRSGWITVTNQR
jgi:hypothetical protein